MYQTKVTDWVFVFYDWTVDVIKQYYLYARPTIISGGTSMFKGQKKPIKNKPRVHYGLKQPDFPALINYFPCTYVGVLRCSGP